MEFQVFARAGNPYTTKDDQLVSVLETTQKISNPETQTEALSDLGITINGINLKIEFSETGNPYAEPQGDRTKIAEKTTQIAIVEIELQQTPPLTLDIETSVKPFIKDGVNFFGCVTFKTPDGEIRSIPMTGRGTAALEGKANDAHSGYCTGGACASFQQRTALVLAVAAAAGASNSQIDLIKEYLNPLCEQFHGRNDLLDYSVEAAKNSLDKMPSYTEFMKERYLDLKCYPLLESIVNTGKPNKEYYEKALQKMTDEELAEDAKNQ